MSRPKSSETPLLKSLKGGGFNPVREAIAISYQQSDAAPRVVAKGKGIVAEQIIEKAKEHGVYVHESAELVALLTQVDIDEHIPPQLYMAVAELLAWLYRLEHGEDFAQPKGE